MTVQMKIIAHIENDFSEKFGIPRQSGLADVVSKIVFEPEYRNEDAFRGIEGYSHLWLIWLFSEAVRDEWSPTVRPPRLGGNKRMGVFATRSPFRPNAIGLSSVKLVRMEYNTPEGPVLWVSGADIMNGTPVFDIKPYLAYTDSHPDAESGFAMTGRECIEVVFPDEYLEMIPEEKRESLISLLSQDPRPAYQNDRERVYTMSFGGLDISFRADDKLYVCGVRKI